MNGRRRLATIAAAVVAAVAVTAGHAGTAGLPPPSFSVAGSLTALAAAGSRVAVATNCGVRVADLLRGTRPLRVQAPGMCSDAPDSTVYGLWLGRTTLAAQVVDSPSPHGEWDTLWTGAPPAGPLHQLGAEWGWTDSDVPAGRGCAWSVAAGNGAVALAQMPNRSAVDEGLATTPSCPAAAGSATRVTLQGATRTQLTVPGSWSILATDGKRVALAALDAAGAPTGQLALVAADGSRLSAPPMAAAAVRAAYDGWLTPHGLVLRTKKGISGPGWTIGGIGSYPVATIAEGRLLYLKGRTVRMRRLRDGAERPLVTLPTSVASLAAGSFGLAVATFTDTRTTMYRLPWRTIDRVLTAR